MAIRTERLRVVARAEIAAHGPRGGAPFDVHAHTGLDVDGTARSCEEHVADLERLGARSAIFPLCVATGYDAENRRVLAECRRDPDRLVPFARIDPRAPGPGAAARDALAAGAVGLKLHPRGEAFAIDHPGVDEVVAAASAARVPLVVHAGRGVGSFGAPLLELARRHRGCRIVLAHAGISDLGWLWRDLDDHPNLFFDTAWWNPADLLALFALVPPGRILWGSDAPYGEVDVGLAIALRCARAAGLSDDALALVVGGQLDALLAGDEPVDAGPAPAPREPALSPIEARALSALTGLGGCMIGGGDVAELFALARLAVAPLRDGGDAVGALVADLFEEIARSPADAQSALVLALTLAATPRLGVAEAVADDLAAGAVAT
jgi:uncharacterized protein